VFPLHSLSGSVYLLAAGLSWIQGKSPFERLVQLNSRLYRKLHPPSPSLATSYARTAPCIRRVPQARFSTWVLGLPFPVLSSRADRPDFLFRAELWRVGSRSAICAPRALRRGRGICFFLVS